MIICSYYERHIVSTCPPVITFLKTGVSLPGVRSEGSSKLGNKVVTNILTTSYHTNLQQLYYYLLSGGKCVYVYH